MSSPPASDTVELSALGVAGAVLSLLLFTAGGLMLGAGLGLGVFLLEEYAGWLDGAGRGEWLLLPLDVLVTAAAFGFAGFMSALRRALRSLLVDSGVLRRWVERGLARVRKADEAQQLPREPAPPRGWLGSRIHGFGQAASRVIVENLRSSAAPQAETAITIDATARALIDEWGETLQYLGYGAVALAWIGPPLVLAFTT
jgi:hypothetical protein